MIILFTRTSYFCTKPNFTMKRTIESLLLAATLATSSCNLLFDSPETVKGGIRIVFASTGYPLTKASAVSMPDTNSFILTVTDVSGNTIYHGTYGEAPETILADPGTYTIMAESCLFSEPIFDRPQYGDTQIVTVTAGETTMVTLNCVQINCGIKLNINPNFLTRYPDGVLFVKSPTGKLMYSYSEKRIAYFQPGNISVILSDSGNDVTLFSRALNSQQVLSVNISAGNGSVSSGGGISVQVDTSRTWLTEYYTIGNNQSGGTGVQNAWSVAEARKNSGKTEVWVYGYIVGGDLSSSKCSFKGPFSSKTNLVIAAKSSCTDKASCLSVQLAKGNIRDEINLVDHPDHLKKQIFLKGDIVSSYYGIPGIQSLTEYEFK